MSNKTISHAITHLETREDRGVDRICHVQGIGVPLGPEKVTDRVAGSTAVRVIVATR